MLSCGWWSLDRNAVDPYVYIYICVRNAIFLKARWLRGVCVCFRPIYEYEYVYSGRPLVYTSTLRVFFFLHLNFFTEGKKGRMFKVSDAVLCVYPYPMHEAVSKAVPYAGVFPARFLPFSG